jgi:hypothetical protein
MPQSYMFVCCVRDVECVCCCRICLCAVALRFICLLKYIFCVWGCALECAKCVLEALPDRQTYERMCCLLVLNLVTSTPQWIRRPGWPRDS